MGNQFLIGALVFGLLFGGVLGNKLGKLNPFKRGAAVVQKSEQTKEEYFKDKIKGTEYRFKESSKMQNKENAGAASATIGSRVGNFIDTSIQLILFVVIGGTILFFVTGINIFTRFKKIVLSANRYRKALKQTVKAVNTASPKMNGEDKVLKNELARSQDEDTKNLINEMKNE